MERGRRKNHGRRQGRRDMGGWNGKLYRMGTVKKGYRKKGHRDGRKGQEDHG